MKTLKKIKLNHYADEELKEREMNLLRGGSDDIYNVCVCATGNRANARDNVQAGYTTSSGEGTCYMLIDDLLHQAGNKEIWT